MISLKPLWTKIKDDKAIIITLLSLIIVGLICWLYKPTTDFGLNFFTEMSGAAITVFVIDQLIAKRDERKNLPQKVAAYEDIRLYTTRYINFWIETYYECVPESYPLHVTDFFSVECFQKILANLDMNAEPNVSPKRKWWDWIVSNAKEFKETGDKILNRHSNLDPVAFGLLHQLTESSFNNGLILIPAIRLSILAMLTQSSCMLTHPWVMAVRERA